MMAEQNQTLPSIAYDPALLHRVKTDLDTPIIGEVENKLTLFLVGVSSWCEEKVHLSSIITGESSAGKSWLMNNTLKYFSNVKSFSRITAAAPDRLEEDMSHIILKVEELKGADAAQSTLRIMISEGKLELLTTDKGEGDQKGKIITRTITTKGTPCFVTSTTTLFPDEELMNRTLVQSVDETAEQTKKILEREAKEFMEVEPKWEPDPEICALISSLHSYFNVLIPYADLLAKKFPAVSLKSRRDFKKLLNLIYVCAYLHQHQRPIIQNPENKVQTFILALPQDFYMVWEIVGKTFRDTLENLQERHRKVLAVFEGEHDSIQTSQSIAAKTGYGDDRARQLLNSLTDKGYLTCSDEHRPYSYALNEKGDPSVLGLGDTLDSFGEYDLDFYCGSRNLSVKERGFQVGYVSPISGKRRAETG